MGIEVKVRKNRKKKSSYKDIHGKTRVGKILEGIADVSPAILEIAAKVTGVEGLSSLADLIRGSDGISPEDKTIILAELDADIQEAREITARWTADMSSDSWWSKNIRPMILGYTWVFLTGMFIVHLAGVDLKDPYLALMSELSVMVNMAYFGSRGAEKIFEMFTK